MLSMTTSGYVCCQYCNVRFQRLSSHLSRNEFCGAYYKNMPLDTGNGGVTDDMHGPGVAYFNKAGTTIALLAHENQQEITGVLQHLGMWWVMIFPLTNQFLTMMMMPLLCLTGTTLFLAARNLMIIAMMRRFPMGSFWIVPGNARVAIKST